MKHRIPIVTHRALPDPHARGPAGAGLKIWTVASGPAAESIGPADMNWQSSGPCAPTSRPIWLALPLAQQSISTIHYFHPNPIKSLPKLRGTPTSSPKAYSPAPAITGIVQSSPAANMDAACGSLQDTELRLGLPGTDPSFKLKRAFTADSSHLNSPSSKAQVVGWPPVRSNRRNSFQGKRSEAAAEAAEIAGVGILVKVSMDGAPYLRKIDLKLYKGYRELRDALEDMFKCFSFSSESELSDVEAYSGTEYAIAYEDKDGDWMLAGDVPWKMFISSCKRLRIMKGSEAKGLASSSSSSA